MKLKIFNNISTVYNDMTQKFSKRKEFLKGNEIKIELSGYNIENNTFDCSKYFILREIIPYDF